MTGYRKAQDTISIPVAGPWITEREIAYVADAAGSAWYEGAGQYVARFETAMAEYTGRRYAISLPSCTSAIHLSLVALGIGPGDEVVVPDITWIATAAPIAYVGATAVFADIDPDTWCMGVESLATVLTDKTRAVIPVDLYGGMPDHERILALTSERGIPVIEDAAQAVGSEYSGRRAGSFGTLSVFSFHGSKTLVTGEGGMVVTDDTSLHDRMRVLRDHGRPPGDTTFVNSEIAFKYKMTDLQAALGLAQIERVYELVAKKRQIFEWYETRLRDLSEITLNAQPVGVHNSYWMVTAIVRPDLGIEKDHFAAELGARGITTRPFFHPLSSLPAYGDSETAQVARSRNTHSYQVSPFGINLPSALRLAEADIDRVCTAIRSVLGHR